MPWVRWWSFSNFSWTWTECVTAALSQGKVNLQLLERVDQLESRIEAASIWKGIAAASTFWAKFRRLIRCSMSNLTNLKQFHPRSVEADRMKVTKFRVLEIFFDLNHPNWVDLSKLDIQSDLCPKMNPRPGLILHFESYSVARTSSAMVKVTKMFQDPNRYLSNGLTWNSWIKRGPRWLDYELKDHKHFNWKGNWVK